MAIQTEQYDRDELRAVAMSVASGRMTMDAAKRRLKTVDFGVLLRAVTFERSMLGTSQDESPKLRRRVAPLPSFT